MGSSESKTIIANENDLAKDLTGKVIVVTGGNSGIGLQTVTQLTKQNATVVMCCRNLEKGNVLAEKITSEQKGTVAAAQLDLASLASVRAFAEHFEDKFDRLDILVNNAGVMNSPESKTADGFELQMGTNHLGHFYLTNLLLPRLRASAPSRIVILSSCASYGLQGKVAEIDFDDMFFSTKKYDGWQSYCNSKLANLLHAKELARRYGDEITTVAVHPGFVESNLLRHTTGEEGGIAAAMGNFFFKGAVGMINPWEGTQASLRAILSDEAKEHNGQFFSQAYSPKDAYPEEKHKAGGWLEPAPHPAASDAKIAGRLWDVSLKLVNDAVGVLAVDTATASSDTGPVKEPVNDTPSVSAQEE